jgi:perosamine synthetase
VTDEIRLAYPDVGEEELRAIASVLEDGMLTMGPRVAEFEAEIARACNTAHAVAVSSGTAALHLALAALDIGPGDEVIVPAYTFPATANVVRLLGADVRMVDVDAGTMNTTPELVADAVGPRTRAVLAVHLFGRPLDWDGLAAAVPDGVALVEDAAGALGARARGRPCGSLGVAGCLSFHPRKIVTTGEGGAVTTDDSAIAERVRSLRHHGIVPGDGFEIAAPGFNYRLSDILCAAGTAQMRRLAALLEARREIATLYTSRLADDVLTPKADDGDVHGWQAYVVQLERRDDALEALRAEGIQAQIGTYAVNRLGAYKDSGEFPGADACFARALALPLHSRLHAGDIDRVSAIVRSFA